MYDRCVVKGSCCVKLVRKEPKMFLSFVNANLCLPLVYLFAPTHANKFRRGIPPLAYIDLILGSRAPSEICGKVVRLTSINMIHTRLILRAFDELGSHEPMRKMGTRFLIVRQ